jgi:hypothetical protein
VSGRKSHALPFRPGAHNLTTLVFMLILELLAATWPATAQIASPKPQTTEPRQAAKGSQASAPKQTEQEARQKLLVTVLDENSVAVSAAHLILMQKGGHLVFKGESDYAGHLQFYDLPPGIYSLSVEKEGFYVVTIKEVRVGETDALEVTLNHAQEYVESVNVEYSPPTIDLTKTTASEDLNSQEIVNIPYTLTRDIRYALPLMPQVLQDAFGQIHVAGSSTRQIFDQLDGFNISDPASGLFNLRTSVDAIRSVDVQTSRYSAEYGKGSGGILSLRTLMGDNRLRFLGSDIFPTLQNLKGLHVHSWTPRATVSGPLRKDKAWFMDALDGDYNLLVVRELPRGADRNAGVRVNNLAKAQVNLTPANILTTSFAFNGFHANHAGLSALSPIETTFRETDSAYFFSARDQAFLSHGVLLETGVGFGEYRDAFYPLGNRPYVVTPERTAGNFFETLSGRSSRLQGTANLFLPPAYWNGRHEFKVGLDLDRITEREAFVRNPILIVREDGTLARKSVFSGGRPFVRDNFEASGYAQDRWSPSDRWLVEPGLRYDWDEIVRDVLVSPRLAFTHSLTRSGNSKLAWGIGIYNDPSNLEILTRALSGERVDYFYDTTGQVQVRPPVLTSFHVNERDLKMPYFLNWSVDLEQQMPHLIYLRLQFLQKRGWDEWTFINQGANQPGLLSGSFLLENERHDRYDAFEVSLRHMFKGNHTVFASYVRSAARSNAVLNFSLDNSLFSQQTAGPLPWDTPNRFISWGFLPLPWKFDFAYSLDFHDGFPFGVVNQTQQLVAPPGSLHFPAYFSLNVSVERRIRLLGFLWAVRAGYDDVTNRGNPTEVINNIDSPHFLTFTGFSGRFLTGRIRLLGRK